MDANLNTDKKNYSKDSIILAQGSSEKSIFLINQGAVEIKKCPNGSLGSGAKDMIKNSRKVGQIDANGIFGFQNILNSKPNESSYVALSDCIITKYAVPAGDAAGFFKSNLSLSLGILSKIVDQVNKDLLNIKKSIDFISAIEKLSDNLSLIYAHVTQSDPSGLYQKFTSNSGSFPPLVGSAFLTVDNSLSLGKTYMNKSYDSLMKFDYEKIKFFNCLLRANPENFANLIGSDSKILLYMFESLSNTSGLMLMEFDRIFNSIQDKLNYFFSDNASPFNMTVSISSKIKGSRNIENGFTNSVVKICKNIDALSRQLGGKEHSDAYLKYDSLGSDAKASSTSVVSAVASSGEGSGKYKAMFKDMSKKVLSFSTLDEETLGRIKKNIEFLKKNPTDELIAKESRTFFRKMQTDFFELYKNITLKVLKKPDDMPVYIKLFLYFAVVDENLISEKQLEFINSCLSILTTFQVLDYPVVTMFEFLRMIYNLEEEPSLAEKGEFRKLVNKNFGKNEKVIEDTPIGKVDFEIENMVSMCLRIVSNNPRMYVPYLMESSFKGPLNQIFVLPKKLDALLKKIVSIDFSLFFRELTWKIPGKSELIRKEIRPLMILAPTAGLRVQMWQELVNNIRSTRARFILPIIFNGDLFKNLIFASGHFRWNMNKALVTNWMDPVEGGLTGAYYDYEQSYKKIPDLSDEVKDKIKKQIKSVKIDRNRFALDYYDWVVFESQGIPKLNRVLRKILYRLIPFPKSIRESIANLPVYSELQRKYEIICLREFKRYEAKFKKYAESGQMPEDLQAYLNLLEG